MVCDSIKTFCLCTKYLEQIIKKQPVIPHSANILKMHLNKESKHEIDFSNCHKALIEVGTNQYFAN